MPNAKRLLRVLYYVDGVVQQWEQSGDVNETNVIWTHDGKFLRCACENRLIIIPLDGVISVEEIDEVGVEAEKEGEHA